MRGLRVLKSAQLRPGIAGLKAAVLLACAVLGSLSAQAAAPNSPQSAATTRVTYRHLVTPSGNFDFTLTRIFHPGGITELVVENSGLRRYIPGLRNDVLYARDLDGDGRMDLWFIPTDVGIVQPWEQKAAQPDGWDVAAQILLKQVRVQDQHGWALVAGAAQALPFTNFIINWNSAEGAKNALHQSMRDQMALYTLETMTDRLRAEDPRDPSLAQRYAMVANGWHELSQQMDHEAVAGLCERALADMAITAATGGMENVAVRIAGVVGPRLAASMLGKLAARIADRYSKALAEANQRVATRVMQKFPGAKRVTAAWRVAFGGAQWLRGTIEDRVGGFLEAMSARNRTAEWAVATVRRAGRSVRGAAAAGWDGRGYILQTQGIQVVAELGTRWHTLYNPNPIIFAKNVVNDRDLMLNLLYMTNETFWMTGVSNGSMPLGGRVKYCAVIGATDSTAMSLFVMHETDPKRVGLDSFWESIIGNGQTQLDMVAQRMKKENPKLRLIGSIVQVMDQAVGYVGYSLVTQKYEKMRKQAAAHRVVVTPIFAPVSS